MKTGKELRAKQSCPEGAGRSHPGLPEQEWGRLCARYLPVTSDGSIWKHSRASSAGEPEQGWKLHISATVLTACRVLEMVAPLLRRRGLLFKAPATLLELSKLNSGLEYGYSQVGKFLTIYPRTTAEAVGLARRLHRLTYGMAAPSIPFDLKFRPDSCVYYRYGSFRSLEIENPDGSRTQALRDLHGRLVPDLRDSETARPSWVSDPFALRRRRPAIAAETPLRTQFRVFAAMSQRGKGGVYQAVDLTNTPPRICVLKEGRRDGEVWWDGRDAHTRTQHEEHVLKALSAAGLNVPRVYASFTAEKNFYLALEFIAGRNFERWLACKKRRLTVRHALRYGLQLAELLSKLHAAGWIWRDCKPSNLILTATGELRPLDFEGACPVDRPDPVAWGSPFYAAPECAVTTAGQTRLPEDLYALGVMLYMLLAGRAPGGPSPAPLASLRQNVPACVLSLIAGLLAADPAERPDAASVARGLKSALASRLESHAVGEIVEARVGAKLVEEGLGR